MIEKLYQLTTSSADQITIRLHSPEAFQLDFEDSYSTQVSILFAREELALLATMIDTALAESD